MPENTGKNHSAPKNHDFWYRLDNVGKIFAPVTSLSLTAVFRFSVILKEPVKLELLRQALSNIAGRFPYFQVGLRSGFFWYYLEHVRELPMILPDSRFPCERMAIGKRSVLIRLKVFKNRISAEFSHILTDGAGALTWLKALTGEYVHLAFGPVTDWGDLFRAGQQPDPEEAEDSFLTHYNRNAPPPAGTTEAFHLPYRNVGRKAGAYHVVTGIVPLQKVTEFARSKKVSVNDVLVSVLMESFQEEYFNLHPAVPSRWAPPVRIVVPINLRQFFPSKTMRNFILFTAPEIDPRLGKYTLEEILSVVHHFIRLNATARAVQPAMARNVRGEKNFAVRVVPRFIKDIYLNYKHYEAGQKPATSSLSNVGSMVLPSEIARHIEGFDFIPPPDPVTKNNCGVITFGDRMTITFGRTVVETGIERFFFRRLVQLGIPVKIQTN